MTDTRDLNEHREVVVVGAGIAGLCAADVLRDRDVAVLEARDRVGGRTLSSGGDDVWWNLGAQLITNQRMADLARRLGLELISTKATDFGFAVDGRFARARTPERLALRMNLSWRQKVEFALTMLRLRRKFHAIPAMDAEAVRAMDRKNLLELVGTASPMTLKLISACCEGGCGIALDEVSAVVGLGYGLAPYVDPASKQDIYGIRGGTQRVALRLAESLPEGMVRPGCKVVQIRNEGAGVAVVYEDEPGGRRTITADRCVCAVPATQVLNIVEGLEPERRIALKRITPYLPLYMTAWPVRDRAPAPWDNVFVAPIAGSESHINVLSNYGFLAKANSPDAGGYVNTQLSGRRALAYTEYTDEELIEVQFRDLVRIFPEARQLIDPGAAILKRWDPGLPMVRPGYLTDREAMRPPLGAIHFCGDYTAQPGLPGASGSGYYAGQSVAAALPQAGALTGRPLRAGQAQT
jgi:protoporphyrinogen oxidase